MQKEEQGKFAGAFLIVLASVIVCALFLGGCSQSKDTSATQVDAPSNGVATDATATATPTSIKLNKENIRIAVEYQLEATVEPSGSDQAVTWTSSDPKIATVDDKGLVKAVKVGETEVVATSKANPDVMRGCVVKVANLPTNKDKAHEILDDDRDTVKECLECH